jgi:hypothetical protein
MAWQKCENVVKYLEMYPKNAKHNAISVKLSPKSNGINV